MAERVSRRRVLRLASLSLLGLAGGWRARTAVAQAGPVEIVVETPSPGLEVSGLVQVTGWAIDHRATSGTNVASVSLYVGGDARSGTPLGEARYGLDRPDVAARFGANFGPSGFAYRWDTTALASGPTSLVAYARSASGDWGAATVPLVVAPNRGVSAGSGLSFEFVGVTNPAAPGGEIRIVGKTQPGSACVLLLVSPLGPVAWPGLEPRDADSNGQVQWVATAPASAPRGLWYVAALATLGQQIATAKTQISLE